MIINIIWVEVKYHHTIKPTLLIVTLYNLLIMPLVGKMWQKFILC
ncbi:Uncharacterized protein YR821_1908 [Yersinia ruckeri]|uniref:Uncharacterized protein n=1 Tax=Yersinia ruckeri TaxID=29486 RepID=A0A0A8VDC6_YERRU|nr:Uncharacterized protein YR821_1908 [Yersinia ruckeri]CEK27727.1 hypothetical protein CSF007_9885 [Yersinia ruckeri]